MAKLVQKQKKVAAPSVAPVELQELKVRQITKSPDFVSIYANDVRVQTGPWDMLLILSEISHTTPGTPDEAPVLTIKQLGELRISPQLAKKLTAIMIEQLNGYEERFGAIPGPKD
jgi:Protein of unknown function (DUF3467)